MNDYSTEEGARRIADRIKAYWAERGETVEVEIEPVGFDRTMRSTSFVVRSNLIAGRPPSAHPAVRRGR